MDKIKIEKEAIVLDEKEKENLISILHYFLHRANSHPGCGADRLELGKFAEYLTKNL